ncbi:MAG: hypothetical protein Q9170_000758 [Blastenia crenularia]
MDFDTTVSKNLILAPDDEDLTPRPLRVNKRNRLSQAGSLNIRKQRHSCTAHTSLATRNVNPTSNIRRGATMSYPPAYVKYSSAREQDEAACPAPTTRATSLNPLQRAPTFANQIANSPQSASMISQQQSTALNSEKFHGISKDTLQRESSFRLRFLSRVMNGLMSRSASNPPMAPENAVERSLAEKPTEYGVSDSPNTARHLSTSTADTYSSLESDLETALDAFPEPPLSNLTSPTETSSFEHNQHDTRLCRVLCPPSEIVIVQPEVTIIPEVETMDINASQSMYVAVEIEVGAKTPMNVPYAQTCGLDVAVIIDNSQFASPATLMASSNPRKTKAVVDTIISSTERPNRSTLDAAVRSARALLEQSTPRDQNSALSPLAFGHIFVLTANSTGIAPDILSHDTIQLHLVCAGSVPWKGEGKVRCNGWKLQSMEMKEPQSLSCSKDEDAASLFNRLRATIVDARKGLLHGAIGDLVLDIRPAKNCTIEGVIGVRNIPSLQQGERSVALVRLNVGLPPATGYTLIQPPRRDDSSPVCNDLDKDLDKLLGTAPVAILNVKLKYRHSLLSSDTQCTLSTHCRLKRQLRSAEWDSIRSTATPRKPNNPQIELQKRFAFHIATHHAPRQAMMVLVEDFGDGGRRSACPEFIKLLIEELRYQARTVERFDLAEYRSGPVMTTPRELRPDIWGQEHFGQGLFDASNYRPQEWITDVPDEIMVQLPWSPAKLKPKSQDGHHRSESEETASGTVLKRKPRRQAIHGSGIENQSSVSTETEVATKGLKDVASKSKRSLGAETLKFLAYPQYRG